MYTDVAYVGKGHTTTPSESHSRSSGKHTISGDYTHKCAFAKQKERERRRKRLRLVLWYDTVSPKETALLHTHTITQREHVDVAPFRVTSHIHKNNHI